MPEDEPTQEEHQAQMQPATLHATIDDQHDPRRQHHSPTGQGKYPIGDPDTAIGYRPRLHSSQRRQTLTPKRRHEEIAEQHHNGQDVHNSHQPLHTFSLVFRAPEVDDHRSFSTPPGSYSITSAIA